VLLALAVLAVGVIGTYPAGFNQPGSRTADAAAFTLVAVAALALVVRRVWPLATLGVVSVAVSAYLIANYAYGPILFSLVVAAYTVASRLPTRRAAIASAIAIAAILPHVFVGSGSMAGLAIGASWVIVPYAIGMTVRLGREAAERTRAERLRDVAHEERLRVAQEVHDVVGHGLAAINMQAEIALHVLPKRPEQAATALAAISRTSKAALDELRATLALVRSEAAENRLPGPGLAQLDALVARLAGTGVPVQVEIEGEPREVPVAVDLAAYRVVQESLTNVLRHAGAAVATVRVHYGEEDVTVQVTDTGRGGTPADGDGHGIPGMRARVAALGGRFAAGPADGGGFQVYAAMPAPARSGSGAGLRSGSVESA
jgi:signal transduction histidine kinase